MITEAQIKVSKSLQELASTLDDVLTEVAGKKMAFALFVFNEEADGHTQYVANCNRTEVVKALIEFLKRQSDELIERALHDKLN